MGLAARQKELSKPSFPVNSFSEYLNFKFPLDKAIIPCYNNYSKTKEEGDNHESCKN